MSVLANKGTGAWLLQTTFDWLESIPLPTLYLPGSLALFWLCPSVCFCLPVCLSLFHCSCFTELQGPANKSERRSTCGLEWVRHEARCFMKPLRPPAY